tara:strand:+ start:260 stop:598 length:339 start_codon:yes stop_codon:yes gene_type:complete
MKLLKRLSIRVIIFLKIKVKSLNNLLESALIEFSLSLVNIFTMLNQIRNEVRRVIKTLIIEEYFFLIRAIFAMNRNQNNYSKKKEVPNLLTLAEKIKANIQVRKIISSIFNI